MSTYKFTVSMISNQASLNDQTMALRILYLLSLLTFSYAGILPFFDPRIVNGEDAKVGEIPYQVSLQEPSSSFHFCGGSILNDDYIITAAHCVENKFANEIKVVSGTINLTQPKSQHKVIKIIVHKEYDPSNSWINDIALLKVIPPFKKSVTVGHIPLPSKDDIKTNDIAVVSGWGTLWKNGPITNKLQRVNIFISSQGFCKAMYNDIGYNIYPTHICANDPSTEKGSCNGDSGGPLTVNGKLVGLVSWAFDCASTSYPTIYTRVVSYLDWINDNAV